MKQMTLYAYGIMSAIKHSSKNLPEFFLYMGPISKVVETASFLPYTIILEEPLEASLKCFIWRPPKKLLKIASSAKAHSSQIKHKDSILFNKFDHGNRKRN